MTYPIREHPASDCTACPLSQSRTQVVWGRGNPDAPILLLGEAPGFNEDTSGYPFVGQAGRKLDQLLSAARISVDEVYITNVVRCRPPSNRRPLPLEVESCGIWLEYEVADLNPLVVVTLGKTSAGHFIRGIERVPRGIARRMEWYGRPVVVLHTYHPAAVLGGRNPGLAQFIVEDLARARSLVHTIRSTSDLRHHPAVS